MLSRTSLESFLKAVIYLTFFVPLVVMPSSFIFPFIVPKVLALRILVTVMIGAYSLLLVSNWQLYKPRFTPLTIAVLLFFLSFGASTFIGVDPYHSFWDNHERMLGLFTVLHYAVYFVICTTLLNGWRAWQTALRIFLIAGSLVMISGILQIIWPDFLLNQGSSRIIGTLGNAIYMGGYGLFLTFVAALLFLKERVIGWRIAYAVMGVLGLVGMLASGTRGSLLGLFFALGFAIIAYAVVLKDQPRFRIAVASFGVCFAVVVGLLIAFRTTPFVSKLPAVGRAVNTTWEETKNSSRFIAWEIAIKAWREKPVFGWGPNNYYFAYNKYYDPRALDFGYGETWFDNAHNIIVNTMAVQGTFGIATYLGIFVVAFIVGLQSYRKGLIDRHAFIIGIAFLVAHLVQDVTVFENITSYLYFMFWLAMMNQLSAKPLSLSATPERQVGGGVVVTGLLVTSLLVFIFDIQPARANHQSLLTLRDFSGDPVSAIASMKETLAFSSPHIDDIQTDLARSGISLLTSDQGKSLNKEKMAELFSLTYDALQKTLELHPLDIRIHFMLSQLLQNQALQTRDVRFMQEAEQLTGLALELSPERQQLAYSLSVIKLQLNKPEEARSLLLKTKESNPLIAETYWRLAYVYIVMQRPLDAEKELQAMLASGVIVTPPDRTINSQLHEQLKTLATTTAKTSVKK
jgi:O-antigen ligase